MITNKNTDLDIYLIDSKNVDLYINEEQVDVDEITLRRITMDTINKTKAKEENPQDETKSYKSRFRSQNIPRKIILVTSSLALLIFITLGCITLVKQYVPGSGFLSSSSKLEVLATPYTVWKDGYFLRIRSLSYDPDSKLLSFTVEGTGVDGMAHDTGDKTVSGGIYLKEKWSRVVPYEESLGKGHYSYGNPTAEYHDVLKVKNKFEDYYFELDVVDVIKGTNGTDIYIEKPNHIEISLGDLKLVPAKEADDIEDFGPVVKDKGISAVAVSRWEAGKLYSDILFKSTDSRESVVSYFTSDNEEINLITEENVLYKNMAGKSQSVGWKYLLFDTAKPEDGKVILNSLFVEKKLKNRIELETPKIGETILLNREIDLGGHRLLLESISAYKEVNETINGEIISYKLPNNEVEFKVKCRIIEGIYNERLANQKSYLRGEIEIGTTKNTSKSIVWGNSGIEICSRFTEKEIVDKEKLILILNEIALTVEGKWEIPVTTK